jgi:tRNA-dihydrouridine synthase B
MNDNFWLKLKKPIIGLAPMDGVTDAAFRFITAAYGGPDVIYTEFTPVEGLSAGAVKAAYSLIYDRSERPIVAQFFGKTAAAFYKSAFVACELGFDGIDINMGCPAKNIASKGAGAGLILNPKLAGEIVRAVQQGARDWHEGKKVADIELPSAILEYLKKIKPNKVTRKLLPISIKTRLGHDKAIVESWIGQLLETKPAAITIHGRTYKQGYSGLADWNAIANAAKLIHSAGALALGNGDVKSAEDAREKCAKYGVDGVLIGRAAFGNPWIFKGREPTLEEKFTVATEHANKFTEIFGRAHFAPMKKHLAWYCRGFPGAAAVRQQLMQADSTEEVTEIFKRALIYKKASS